MHIVKIQRMQHECTHTHPVCNNAQSVIMQHHARPGRPPPKATQTVRHHVRSHTSWSATTKTTSVCHHAMSHTAWSATTKTTSVCHHATSHTSWSATTKTTSVCHHAMSHTAVSLHWNHLSLSSCNVTHGSVPPLKPPQSVVMQCLTRQCPSTETTSVCHHAMSHMAVSLHWNHLSLSSCNVSRQCPSTETISVCHAMSHTAVSLHWNHLSLSSCNVSHGSVPPLKPSQSVIKQCLTRQCPSTETTSVCHHAMSHTAVSLHWNHLSLSSCNVSHGKEIHSTDTPPLKSWFTFHHHAESYIATLKMVLWHNH